MVAGLASTGRQLVLHCCWFHPPALLLQPCSPVRMAEVDCAADDDDHEGDVLDCFNVADELSQSALILLF